MFALHAAGAGTGGLRQPGYSNRVTWRYEVPPNLLWLRLWLGCNFAVAASALGAGASSVFLLVICYFLIEAGQRVRVWRFYVGFRSREQRRLPQSCVWIHVQDSSGMGVADGGDECSG